MVFPNFELNFDVFPKFKHCSKNGTFCVIFIENSK